MSPLLALVATAQPIEGPDRSTPPPIGEVSWLELAEPEIHPIREGLAVWLVPVEGFRKVEIEVVLHRGQVELGGRPSFLLAAMGELGAVATAAQGPAELEELQALHDLGLESWIGTHRGVVRVSAPREELARGVELLGEVLFAPTYPRREVALWRREALLSLLVRGPSDPGTAGSAAMTFAWVPADHPYGARPERAAVKRVDPRALRAAHDRWLAEAPVTVVAVGDLGWDALEPVLRPLLTRLGGPDGEGRALEVRTPSSRRIAVDFPGQDQAGLTLRLAAPVARHPDREAFEVAAYALGGHFASRLGANLREEKGYTYGVSGRYFAGETFGTYQVSVEVAVENAAEAIAEIEAEIARLVEGGITDDEHQMAIRSAAFGWGDTRRDAASTARFYRERLVERETVGEALARNRRSAALGLDDVRRSAAAWLGPDATRVWVFTGDRTRLEAELSGLPGTVEWIGPRAAVLGEL